MGLRAVRVHLMILLVAGGLVAGQAPAGGAKIHSGEASDRALARDGRIVFDTFDPATGDDTSIMVVNPDGTGLRVLSPVGYQCPNWSPNGRVVAACGDAGGRTETWLIDARTGAVRGLPMPNPRLTSLCFKWTPDGRRLGCEAWDPATSDPVRGGQYSVRSSDGRQLTKIVEADGVDGNFGGYAPDGRSIVYRWQPTDSDSGLYVVGIDGRHRHRLTEPALFVGSGGDYAPGGRWIAFSAHPTAERRQTIFVVHPDGSGLHRLRISERGKACGGEFTDPSAVGCTDPSWSPDGRYLVYRYNTPDSSDLHVVRVCDGHVVVLTTGMFTEFPDWGGTHPHER